MLKIIQKLKEKLQDVLSQKGQGMVEYAIIIAVVAVIAIAVLGTGDAENDGDNTLTGAVSGAFKTATDKINEATGKEAEEEG